MKNVILVLLTAIPLLSNAAPTVQWATYYGDQGSDRFHSIVHDSNGNVYISGTTSSINNIATLGSHQAIYGGGLVDIFVSKFNANGVRLWTTYYGGLDEDANGYLTLDGSEHLYLAGSTNSNSDISTTGSYQQFIAGGIDAFLVKFDTAGVRQWATYYGGTMDERISAITSDASGNVYLVGNSFSSIGLSTVGCHQPGFTGTYSSFLAKFSSQGQLLWGTYYGGGDYEGATTVCCDNNKNVYIAGVTTNNSVIATVGSHQPTYGGGTNDVYIAKFDSTGIREWGTYYGGSFDELSGALSCYNNNIYLLGTTSSLSNISTVGSHQPMIGGGIDAFLVKFNTSGSRQWATYFGGTNAEDVSTDWGRALDLDDLGNIYISGSTLSDAGISTIGSFQNFRAGEEDLFLAKFDDNGIQLWGTYYGGPDKDQFASCDFDEVGNIYLSGISQSTINVATVGSYQSVFGGGVTDALLIKFNDCLEPPQPGPVAGNIAVCVGDTVAYSILPVAGATSYTWSFPNGWIGNSSTNSIQLVTNSSGGTITVTANSSCAASLPQVVTVISNPLPTPVITQNGSMLSTSAYSTYQWYKDGIIIVNATNQDYVISSEANYFVIVTDNNGCTDTSNIIYGTLNVPNLPRLSEVTVFPNPNTGTLFICGALIENEHLILIQMVDIVGRLISSDSTIPENGKILYKCDTKLKGQYFLRIQSSKDQRTLPITIN